MEAECVADDSKSVPLGRKASIIPGMNDDAADPEFAPRPQLWPLSDVLRRFFEVQNAAR
jgi:hypothetical protein